MTHIHAAPRTSFVSTTAERLLNDLPPFMRASADVQAAIDSCAAEMERLDGFLRALRNNFFPQLGEEYLHIWEALLRLTQNPADKTLAQRRSSVLAYLQKLKSSGTATEWVSNLTRLIGTGWSFKEHDPADGVLRIKIPYSTAVSAPTGLAATPGGGGTLAADTYYYVVTATTFYGETTPSAEVSAVVAADGTVALDWDNVAGATGYRVYRGTDSGVINLRRIATSLAASAYTDDGSAVPSSAPPPNANTTASFSAAETETLARAITPAHLDLEIDYGVGFIVGVSPVGEDPL